MKRAGRPAPSPGRSYPQPSTSSAARPTQHSERPGSDRGPGGAPLHQADHARSRPPVPPPDQCGEVKAPVRSWPRRRAPSPGRSCPQPSTSSAARPTQHSERPGSDRGPGGAAAVRHQRAAVTPALINRWVRSFTRQIMPTAVHQLRRQTDAA